MGTEKDAKQRGQCSEQFCFNLLINNTAIVLPDLPLNVLVQLFNNLEGVTATCLGLTSKSLWAIFRTTHQKGAVFKLNTFYLDPRHSVFVTLRFLLVGGSARNTCRGRQTLMEDSSIR